jgi:hypothetical protein
VNPIDAMRNDLYNHYPKKVGSNTKDAITHPIVIGVPDPINTQYHVIAFSHYPIFCSKTNDDL